MRRNSTVSQFYYDKDFDNSVFRVISRQNVHFLLNGNLEEIKEL